MSTDDGDRIGRYGVPDSGWSRNRAIDSEGHRLVILRRPSATAEEGVFTCHIPGDFGTPVSVGIYYQSESYMYMYNHHCMAVNLCIHIDSTVSNCQYTCSGIKVSSYEA